jgi:hypothetical protein
MNMLEMWSTTFEINMYGKVIKATEETIQIVNCIRSREFWYWLVMKYPEEETIIIKKKDIVEYGFLTFASKTDSYRPPY